MSGQFSKSYNLAVKLKRNKVPVLPKVMIWMNRVLFSCDVQINMNIDKSVKFPHNALGVVINNNAEIGRNTKILQNVTIGGNMDKIKVIDGKEVMTPIIGENVLIGAGSQILGPVKIGNNAKIGAGSIVMIDIPEDSIALGIPAKIIEWIYYI